MSLYWISPVFIQSLSNALLLSTIYLCYLTSIFSTGSPWKWLSIALSVHRGIISFCWLLSGSPQSIYMAIEKQSRFASPGEEILWALQNFFKYTWFTRVWIIQEAAAAREVIVVCSSYELPWKTLRSAGWRLAHLTSQS